MRKLVAGLAIGLLVGTLATVAAQSDEKAWVADNESCQDKMIATYRLVADPNYRDEQEANIHAAEAYRAIWDLGGTC